MKTMLIVGLIALITLPPALAKDKPKTHKEAKPGARVAPAAAKPVVVVKPAPPKHPWVGRNVAIAPSERDVIRAYVHNRIQASKGGKFNGLPQGLAKKVSLGALPRGWQKQCVRGEVLPPEVHKRCHSLPDDIIVKLPPPPPGTVLLAVEGKILRVGYPTYEILDVFDIL